MALLKILLCLFNDSCHTYGWMECKNSLPEIVISAATTDTFIRRLDKFWQHQDMIITLS